MSRDFGRGQRRAVNGDFVHEAGVIVRPTIADRTDRPIAWFRSHCAHGGSDARHLHAVAEQLPVRAVIDTREMHPVVAGQICRRNGEAREVRHRVGSINRDGRTRGVFPVHNLEECFHDVRDRIVVAQAQEVGRCRGAMREDARHGIGLGRCGEHPGLHGDLAGNFKTGRVVQARPLLDPIQRERRIGGIKTGILRRPGTGGRIGEANQIPLSRCTERAAVGDGIISRIAQRQIRGRALAFRSRERGGEHQRFIVRAIVGIGPRLIMREDLLGPQHVVVVDGEITDIAFVGVVAQSGFGVVRTDRQICGGAAILRRLRVGGIKRGGVGRNRDTIHVGGEDTLPLIVAAAIHIAVLGLRLPSEDEVLPFADFVVRVRQHILSAAPGAAVHAEVPAVTFTGGIGEVRIALEDHPARAIRGHRIAVVDRALASLCVAQRTKPRFKGERNARVGVVAFGPRHRRGGIAVPVVVGRSAIAGGRMTDIRRVSGDAGGARFAQVDRDVGARGDFVEAQVSHRVVRLDQGFVRNRAARVGRVLIMALDLGRRQLRRVEGEFIHPAEVRVQARARRVVVIADGETCRTGDGFSRSVIIGIGRVAGRGPVRPAGPGDRVREGAINIHAHRGVRDLHRIVHHHDVGPFPDLIRNQARNVQAGAAARAAVHAEVPAHLLATVVVRARLALEEHPALAARGRGRVCIAVVHRRLPCGSLVAGRVEPRLNRERLRVRRVDRGVPGDLGARSEIEKSRFAAVARNRAGDRVGRAQVVRGIARRTEAAAVFVNRHPAGIVVQAIVRLRSVCLDGGGVIGARGTDCQERDGCSDYEPEEAAALGLLVFHTMGRPFFEFSSFTSKYSNARFRE